MDNEKFNSTKYKREYAKQNYDTFLVTVPKGTKAKLQAYCKLQDISLNKLINKYIDSLPL